MVCVGVVAAGWTWYSSESRAQQDQTESTMRTQAGNTTPEGAAEAFLNAWRKREHERAAVLSVGSARRKVEARRARDHALTEEERTLKEQLWDVMAADELTLRVSSAETDGPHRLKLSGVASGAFMGEPYRRETEFNLARMEDRWFVSEVVFGTILTSAPAAFDLDRGAP
ncbi:MAG: hypothetical protein AAF550_04865 [Myxococcota bacterium]